MSHVVPAELVAPLVAEMAVRAPDREVAKIEDHAEDGINLPGMCYGDRPDETFDLDGLSLEIPSEDVREIVGKLKRLQMRHFGEVAYYKLHSFLRCTVLTPRQWVSLISLLEARAPDAERRSEAFYETRVPPSEVFRGVALRAVSEAP